MKSHKTIVDVRQPEEFIGGHVAGSINIPLPEIGIRLDEIRQMPQPLVLCCASGARSNRATEYLRGQGIRCENGGG
jgi:rhodanese-related sulfurtransferase